MNLANVNAIHSRAWAIDRSALERIVARAAAFEGDLFADADPQRLEAMYAARESGSRSGAIAVVPLRGPISHRDNFFTLYFGGTSCERLSATLRQLASDESVGTILLDVDSPGGETGGLVECAALIRQIRQVKPVIAIANAMCASAAIWLASQADELIANPEALVGSIGVWLLHEEWSKYLEDIGIKYTWIHAGERKVDGNWTEPLSERAAAEMQGIVDDAYRLFVADVASGRNVPPATVKSPEWGEGSVLVARDAKKVGMVDRVATLTETIARLAGGKSSSGARAQDKLIEPRALDDGEQLAEASHEPECNDGCDPENGIHNLIAGDTGTASNDPAPEILPADEAEQSPEAATEDADAETRRRRWRLHN